MSVFKTTGDESLSGEVAGYLGFIKDKSQEEIKEAFSKKPPEVQKAIMAKQLEDAGASEFSAMLLKGVDETDPSVKKQQEEDKAKETSPSIEELVNLKFIEMQKAQELKNDEANANKMLKDFFGSSLDKFLESADGKFLLNGIKGAVASGDTYINATTQALNMYRSKTPNTVAYKPSYTPKQNNNSLSLAEQFRAAMTGIKKL